MLRILELFAGIGACSTALDRLGIEHEIVDAVEVDRWALRSFNAIHGTNFETQDIRLWDKDIECDLIMHGSPCQDFSIAGKQAGGDQGSGTRSSLMYETLRIIEKIKPKYVIWENVKNLLSKKHRHNFDNYLDKMSELGYKNYYQVLNAKDYGIPQNRERVFTISIRQDIDTGYTFPEKQELKLRLKDMLEPQVDEKYYLSDKMLNYIVSEDDKYKVNKDLLVANRDIACSKTTREGNTRADTSDYVIQNESQTNIDLNQVIRDGGIYGNRQGGSIYNKRGICPTITTEVSANWNILINDLRIRKLTPKECWRLMGFTDEEFEKAQPHSSNSQLYKQAGNSIVVNVLEKVLFNLLGGLANDK